MGVKGAWPFLKKRGIGNTAISAESFLRYCVAKEVVVDLQGSFYDTIITCARDGKFEKLIHQLKLWIPPHATLVMDGNRRYSRYKYSQLLMQTYRRLYLTEKRNIDVACTASQKVP